MGELVCSTVRHLPIADQYALLVDEIARHERPLWRTGLDRWEDFWIVAAILVPEVNAVLGGVVT